MRSSAAACSATRSDPHQRGTAGELSSVSRRSMHVQGAVRCPHRPSVQAHAPRPRQNGATRAGHGVRLKENHNVVPDVLQGDDVELAAVERAHLVQPVSVDQVCRMRSMRQRRLRHTKAAGVVVDDRQKTVMGAGRSKAMLHLLECCRALRSVGRTPVRVNARRSAPRVDRAAWAGQDDSR